MHIFTRIESSFLKPYEIVEETIDNLHIYRVNVPKQYLYKDKFVNSNIDRIFEKYLQNLNPDIVHFGHLAHLSINLVKIAKDMGKKVIFTLHDFWLFCVKGQLINENDKICDISCNLDVDSKNYIQYCQKCSPYNPSFKEVKFFLESLKEVRDNIDLFLSPSRTLQDFFIKNGVSKSKIIYQKYGFNKNLIFYKRREFRKDSKIKFAFLGRVIPTKGINVLLQAFKNLPHQKLRIYGSIGNDKRFLESSNVEFKGGYDNNKIDSILQDIDVLICPSTWLENSPLVIQEAFLAGVIVITSNIGGMKELLQDRDLSYKDLLNIESKKISGSDISQSFIESFSGFSFNVGDYKDLENLINFIAKNPSILNYVDDNREKVDSINYDARKVLEHYNKLLESKKDSKKLRRVTIDTNPDTCNFKCIMCDTHSIYNKDFKKCRPDMPLRVLNKALKEAKKAGVSEIIPTTMGEPTLYKYFPNIVDFCFNNNIKLNLTTNGSQLFSKRYDENYIISKLLRVLSDVKISFNSLDSKINENIMIKNNTQETLQRIEKLVALRDIYAKNVSITLQMTFMKSNIDSIIPLIEYAKAKGINRIKGHQLWITHNELETKAIYKDKDSIKKWNKLVESLESYKDKIRLENFNLLESNMESNIADSKECPFLGQELWINYKGDVNVCCAPDDKRKALGDFGNVNDNSLVEILESKNYKDLVINYKNKEICKQCLLRR